MPDPLTPSPQAGLIVSWAVNTLYQADCLVAALLTGRRNTTVSCLLGLVEQRRYGPVWYWALSPIWLPVNAVARRLFGQTDHCGASVGPFLVEEDKP